MILFLFAFIFFFLILLIFLLFLLFWLLKNCIFFSLISKLISLYHKMKLDFVFFFQSFLVCIVFCNVFFFYFRIKLKLKFTFCFSLSSVRKKTYCDKDTQIWMMKCSEYLVKWFEFCCSFLFSLFDWTESIFFVHCCVAAVAMFIQYLLFIWR